MSRLIINRRALLLAAGSAGLAGALPWPLQAAEPKRGRILKYATLGLDTADPHRHTGSIAVQQIYAEALTSIGPDGAVEPFLARSIDMAPDGKTYTFRLRENVHFHDGTILQAADVVANMERVKSKISGGWLASAMKLVEGFTAPDTTTVVLSMREPYAPLLQLLSELWILSPNSPGWNETITLPIGTGPFKFGEWRPQVRLTAPAHRTYWRSGMPYLDGIEADLRDGVDKALALRSGDIHLANVDTDVATQLAANPAFTVRPLKDAAWFFVAFNNRKPRKPFDDIRVRQALAHAIDKSAFMKFAAGNTGIVTNQMVMPGNLYFDAATHDADPHARPNLEKARALLKDAGVDPAKETIEFVSWQNSYAQVIVQMVRKLGFKVNHVALDDLGAQKRLGQYDWDMNCMSSGPRADVFLRYVRFMSDGPNPVLWGGVQDAEFDRLVKAAVAEPGEAARKALYLDAWRRVMAGYYTVVLGHAANQIAMRKDVQGYDPGFTWSPNWATGGVAQTWLASGS